MEKKGNPPPVDGIGCTVAMYGEEAGTMRAGPTRKGETRMSGSTNRPAMAAPVAAMVLPLLSGCDETATTAPEEPPPEKVAETQQAVPDQPVEYELQTFELGDLLEIHTDGTMTLYRYRDGAVYSLDATHAEFGRDRVPWDPDLWSEVPPRPVHETASWSDFTLCGDECRLTLSEVVRFGDAEGAGAIEGAAPRVTWSEHLGYVVVGTAYVQVFDDDGRFERRVGRQGNGPGEFSCVVDAHVVDGRLVALDCASRAWSIFDLAGEFVDRRPYAHQPDAFVPVGGGRVVVVNRDGSPEADDAPLHLAHIDSGVPSLHFGSRDAWEYNWKERPHAGDVRGSVTGRPGAVWWGAAGSPRVQEWSVDDELLRVIRGELPWFPEVRRPVDRTREPPPTLLRSLALDGRDHLWMVVRTADPEWRGVELERTPEGWRVPPERRTEYMDTRLDIFDLEEQRHIGRHVWDSPYASLINLGGEPAVSIVEHSEAGVPQVVIHQVGWEEMQDTASVAGAVRERLRQG